MQQPDFAHDDVVMIVQVTRETRFVRWHSREANAPPSPPTAAVLQHGCPRVWERYRPTVRSPAVLGRSAVLVAA